MAKAKTKVKAATKVRRGSPKPGKAAVGKSGVMPEIGAARREATGPLATRRTATRAPSPRKAKAQLPGEKAVAKTSQTLPVEPERSARGPGEREPMPAPAVDRRRQIVGTDDPGNRSTR
jgi:hypothetical protein